MKKLYVAIGLVALVALATASFAVGPGPTTDEPCVGCPGPGAGYGPGAGGGPGWHRGYGPGAGRGPGWWASELNLTKEQEDKLIELRKRQWEATKALRDQMYQKRQEMRSLFANPGTDDATIIAKQKELSGLQQKMQEAMVQFRLEERKVFTPEQLNKMKDLRYGYGRGAGRGYGRGPCWG